MANPDQMRPMRVRTRRVNSPDDRVRYIARNILRGRQSPKVHAFAAMALTDYCGDKWCVEPRDWLGEVSALSEHIKNNVRYTLDTFGMDTYRTPDRTLELAIGDCDDMTALAGAVLQAVGYPVWIKIIQTRGNEDFHHIYVLTAVPPQNPKKYIAVDPTQNFGCGWEPGDIVRQRIFSLS